MHSYRFARLLSAAAVLLLAGCSVVGGGGGGPAPDDADPRITAPPAEGPPVRRDLKYVVVDVDVNELRFMDGNQVLWRAPVGTGTGFRLSHHSGRDWQFDTPSGTMYVQYKEQNPTWFIPDWWFIENRRPIPPQGSPERKQEGGLGAAAVYLGNELAIHGTDKPELLGRRVSHGCIRLSNENALRLFHNVQIGTPVIIVGSAPVLGEQPDSVAAFTRQARRVPTPPNPLARAGTQALLTRLDRELAVTADTAHAWVNTAHTLLERGLADDAMALRGLLQRAGQAGPAVRDEEFSTFLADAFSRGSLRVVVSLNRIPEAARDRAARAIVEATMEMWHGGLDEPTAPWPTRRLPKDRLGPEGQAGWDAIARAEAAYRDRYRARPAQSTSRER
ncbi:L,D-transpeptidase [Longimicrobium sp.]|uniref:L,D-transpeptidase n=1 Tax=Longimicrobium sp. TaxID=2029185 RepID=UPI002E34C18D|nr:L,D-transpeptidase [Longimicrobium sp.]HEX6037972.1 L,D-transpeptidase [Longimicrobium sp.]